MVIRIISGSWYTTPLPMADVYLDCRVAPHPPADCTSLEDLRCWGTTNDAMDRAEAVYWDTMTCALSTLKARRPSDIPVLTIRCLCAEGRYRSVASAECLADDLRTTLSTPLGGDWLRLQHHVTEIIVEHPMLEETPSC